MGSTQCPMSVCDKVSIIQVLYWGMILPECGSAMFSSATEAGEPQTTPISTGLTEAEWRYPGSNRPATYAITRWIREKPHYQPLEAGVFIAQRKTANVAVLSALLTTARVREEKMEIARIWLTYFKKKVILSGEQSHNFNKDAVISWE